jgi:hypothetical protein
LSDHEPIINGSGARHVYASPQPAPQPGKLAQRCRQSPPPGLCPAWRPLPDRLRIAIGFPSTGRRAKATGECWDSTASADGTFEILIRPDLAEADGALALPVAAALAAQLVQAAVGIPAGKGPLYRRVALGIGLTGPTRATEPGPAFVALVAPILEAAGSLPHARLETERKAMEAEQAAEGAPATTAPRKQVNRHVKCTCSTCGYVVRTARKWLDEVGSPHCPLHGPMIPEVAANGTTMPASLRQWSWIGATALILVALTVGSLAGGYWWGRSTALSSIHEPEAGLQIAFEAGAGAVQKWLNLMQWNNITTALSQCMGTSVYSELGCKACAAPLWIEPPHPEGSPPQQ